MQAEGLAQAQKQHCFYIKWSAVYIFVTIIFPHDDAGGHPVRWGSRQPWYQLEGSWFHCHLVGHLRSTPPPPPPFFFFSFFISCFASLFWSSAADPLFFSLGSVTAGCTKGDPILPEGEAADNRSGGEHERLRVPKLQGHWHMHTRTRRENISSDSLIHMY